MARIWKNWWLVALLSMCIIISGCVVQLNFGIPGAPLIDTVRSTPGPTATILPSLTPSINSGPVMTDAGLAAASSNKSKAPPNATAIPLPENATSSAPPAAEAANPGDENNATAMALSINATPVQDNSSVNSTVTPTVRPAHGVKLIPPGATIVRGVPEFWQLKNTGTATDTYNITALPNGTARIMPARITLQPGGTQYFTVFPQGLSGNATIIAASTTDPNIADSKNVTF